MPWVAAKQFSVPFSDAADYAIGWVDETKFYVFFTATEEAGDHAGELWLHRIQGDFNGKFIAWHTDETGKMEVISLGEVIGRIWKIQKTPDGSFAIFTQQNTSA